MKELFRERDITLVNYYKVVLEAEGIPTLIRNELLMNCGLTMIPIIEFYPALCVMDEEDFEPAMNILRDHLRPNAEAEKMIVCASCGETNPGNFDTCWSCGNLVSGQGDSEGNLTSPSI